MVSGIVYQLTVARFFLVVCWASKSHGMKTHLLSNVTHLPIPSGLLSEMDIISQLTTERRTQTKRRTRRSNVRWYELDSTCLDLTPSAQCKIETSCPEDELVLPLTPCKLASNRPSVFGRSILGRASAEGPTRSFCCGIKNSQIIKSDTRTAVETTTTNATASTSNPERFESLTNPPDNLVENTSSMRPVDSPVPELKISDLDVIPYFRADLFTSDRDQTTAPRSAKNPGKIRKYVSKKRLNNNTDLSVLANQEVTCGQRDLTYKMVRVGRIVGGATAGFSDWPWMAMLLNYGRPRCGATLIAPHVVVTAAHCVSGNRLLTNLTVKLGMFNTNERENVLFPPVLLRVARVIRHPDFDLTTLLNDVAIIQLSEPVKYAPNMLPICIASQEPLAGWNTTILGWGKEEENNTVYDLPSALQAVDIPLIEREECSQYFSQQGLKNLIGAPHICAGAKEGGRDACQGDSGGPMVREDSSGKFELIGVISWGFGCGEPNVPGVYTNIFHYRDWLLETIRTLQ